MGAVVWRGFERRASASCVGNVALTVRTHVLVGDWPPPLNGPHNLKTPRDSGHVDKHSSRWSAHVHTHVRHARTHTLTVCAH